MMSDHFGIRVADMSDAAEIKHLFQDTVLTINRQDYLPEEAADWALCGAEISHFEEIIKNQYVLVAQDSRTAIVGFASITPSGYLHSMFVHKDCQNRGIATRLLHEIERYAEDMGIKRITSEVSITARPFFESKGFVVEACQQRKAKQHLYLTNYRMAKSAHTAKNT